MDSARFQKLSQQYANFSQTRSQVQIDLTNRLTRVLTEANLKRVIDPIRLSPNKRSVSRQDFLYVYCFGTPPLDSEIRYLSFPGQTVYIKYTALQKGLTEQQTKNLPFTYVEQAKLMNQSINKASLTKPIILVYHSFGTYLVSTYLHFYPSQRVIGMIDIGGLPLRFYPQVREFLSMIDKIDMNTIQETLEGIFSNYLMEAKQKMGKSDYERQPSNKYQLLAYIKMAIHQFGIDWVYGQHRQWPKILKCFIYGRNDQLLTQKLLNQKAVYYSYVNKFESNYQRLVSEAYLRLRGQKVDNIQQKFIFNIQGGLHSLQMQKRNKQIIGKIIDQYLTFIEEIYSVSSPKI